MTASPSSTAPGLRTELAWLAPLYATYSFVQLELKLAITPSWFDGQLASNHARLLDFSYFNNEQSRLLQFVVPEALHRFFGFEIPIAYAVSRFVFVLLAFLALHAFFRGYFDRVAAALGVSMQAALMGLSYRNDLQESAPLLLLMFVVCLWRIRDRDDNGFSIAMLIGAMANETCLCLAAVHFFYAVASSGEQPPRRWLQTARRTLLLTLPALVYTVVIRSITAGSAHLGGAWHLPDNLQGLLSSLLANPVTGPQHEYAHVWLLFGPLWIYALVAWSEKPLFLRSAFLMIPLFLFAHLLTGIVSEVRQMLPLGAILIPMALWTLAETHRAGAHEPTS